MSETGGIVTVQSGQFQVSTNSGVSEAELSARLKPATDKARSEAASQLGKAGAEAKRAKAESAEVQTESTEEKPDAEPPKRQIKPIPDKKEAKAEPEAEEKPKAEPEDDEEPGKAEDAPKTDKRGNPRHDPSARVREATREAAEYRRQLAEERQRREALEAQLRPQVPPEPPRQPQPSGKPSASDYETTEEWLDARDAYNRAQWEAELQRRAQEQARDSHLTQAVSRFADASREVVGKISDEVGNLKTTFQLAPNERETGANWIANELVFSPEGAAPLMLYLSERPDELQRIAALLTPRAVSREMAKIEARLEAASAGAAPSSEREDHSRATPPVRPVTGTPYVTESNEYRPGMSLDEYRKVWKKQTGNR